MRDCKGLSIHSGDCVRVQTRPDAAPSIATVIESDSARARALDAVLVEFDNGTRQFMPGTHLEVINAPPA